MRYATASTSALALAAVLAALFSGAPPASGAPAAARTAHWPASHAASSPVGAADCVVVRDSAAGQDLRIEAWGDNAVRVRVVPTGGAFRDDLVSALLPLPAAVHGAAGSRACAAVALVQGGRPQMVSSGNLCAVAGSDSR